MMQFGLEIVVMGLMLFYFVSLMDSKSGAGSSPRVDTSATETLYE